MSHIPNSAMPHAAPSENAQQEDEGLTATLTRSAGKVGDSVSDAAGRAATGAGKLVEGLVDYARENPKTAMAAGAAVIAGVAAAAIPALRGGGGGGGKQGAKSGGGNSGSASGSRKTASKGSSGRKKTTSKA